MQDALDKLANDVKASVIGICVKVADIHRIPRPENEYQKGYSAACADIAEKIRRLA